MTEYAVLDKDSHTPALRGEECVEYQGPKKRRTTNALFFSDNQGIPLAMASPQAGNHAGLYEIEDRIDEIAEQLKEAGIPLDGFSATLTPDSTARISVRRLIPTESSPTYAPTAGTEGK